MSLKPSPLVSIAQKFSYINLWHKVFISHTADVISISQDVSYQIKHNIPIILMYINKYCETKNCYLYNMAFICNMLYELCQIINIY